MSQEVIDNWFSNFKPFDIPLVYQSITFLTNENFYQAMKLPKTEVNLRREIASMLPNKAKLALRENKKFLLRKDWNDKLKLDIMEYGLEWKFQPKAIYQHQLLIMTEDEEIVETNNWHDNWWGNCICGKCKDKNGLNHLGKLLMQIREKYNNVT